MEFKDLYMWGLEPFLTDKRFTDTVHLLCLICRNPHLHVVAALQRSLPKMPRSFIKTQRGKSLMLPFLILGRLRVSTGIFFFVKQFYLNIKPDSSIRNVFWFLFFLLQIM